MLKLDFNERSDSPSPLASDNRFKLPLWRYPDRQPLERQLAAIYQLEAEQILACNGGDEAIMLLLQMAQKGLPVILPLPAFSQYTKGVNNKQVNCQIVLAKADLSIDFEQTLSAVNHTKGAILILTRPNNPSGELISVAKLKALLEASKKNGGWVFLDEAYIEFSQQPTNPRVLLSRYSNLVILRTFSKAFGLAGIRVGYLLGAAALLDQFRQLCLPFNLAQPSMEIASEALSTQNRAQVSRYCQEISANRTRLTKSLQTIGIKVYPSEANFLLIKLAPGQAQAVASFLYRQGISVRRFSEFELRDCLRITIPFEVDRLLATLLQVLVPKLICLDMDGVLIDTSNSYDASIKQTVEALGTEPASQSQIESLRAQGGFNNDWRVSQQLLLQQGVKRSLSEVTDVFQSIYLGDNGNGLASGESAIILPALVEQLSQLPVTKVGVVTGRPRLEAQTGLKLCGLEFAALVSLDDVETPKPSPEGILKLQQAFGRSSWMCGDNPDDMQAAVAAGALAIGIGCAREQTLYAAGADIVLADINQLQSWLRPMLSVTDFNLNQ